MLCIEIVAFLLFGDFPFISSGFFVWGMGYKSKW